jgi:hypothetical protein
MTTRKRLSRKAAPVAAALALLALWLWLPAEARAQWAAPTPGSADINNTNGGNVGVGVGTAAPGAKLDVGVGSPARSPNTDLLLGRGGNVPQLEFYDAAASAAIQYAGTAGGGMAFYVNSPAWTQSLFLSNTGNVGIGTATPWSRLHVVGAITATSSGVVALNLKDTGAPANAKLYQWRSEGGVFRMALINEQEDNFYRQNILVANSAGNVGIGTGNPTSPLTVAGAAGHTAPVLDLQGNGDLKMAPQGVIFFDGNYSYAGGSYIGPYSGTSGAYDSNTIKVTTAGAERLRVTGGGNVGIGTQTPTAKLEVNGDAKVNGALSVTGAITGATIESTYQDVAEWVPSVRKLAAGTVVVLDVEKNNHVVASTAAYDTKVAGVVSGQPGVLLGVGGENKVKVATTGRVKVKVDASRGAIKVGDLLVTSGVEGVAMKSIPVDLGGTPIHRPGTIIGKALEPLEKGVGEILVLLSLQ